VTQSPAGLSNPPKPFVSLNQYDIKVPPSKEFPTSATTTTLFSPQVMQKHVLKSSPILASQLQASIGCNSKPPRLVLQLEKIKTEPPSTSIQKSMKVEEDISSDEDEFEAIEPLDSLPPSIHQERYSHLLLSNKEIQNQRLVATLGHLNISLESPLVLTTKFLLGTRKPFAEAVKSKR